MELSSITIHRQGSAAGKIQVTFSNPESETLNPKKSRYWYKPKPMHFHNGLVYSHSPVS